MGGVPFAQIIRKKEEKKCLFSIFLCVSAPYIRVKVRVKALYVTCDWSCCTVFKVVHLVVMCHLLYSQIIIWLSTLHMELGSREQLGLAEQRSWLQRNVVGPITRHFKTSDEWPENCLGITSYVRT